MRTQYLCYILVQLLIINEIFDPCNGQNPAGVPAPAVATGLTGEKKDNYFLLGKAGTKSIYIVHGKVVSEGLYEGFLYTTDPSSGDAVCQKHIPNSKVLSLELEMVLTELAPEDDRLEVANFWTNFATVGKPLEDLPGGNNEKAGLDVSKPPPGMTYTHARICITCNGYQMLDGAVSKLPYICVLDPNAPTVAPAPATTT